MSFLHSDSPLNVPLPAALQKFFAHFSSNSDAVNKTNQMLKMEFAKVHRELEDTKSDLERKREELQIATDYLDALLGHISQGILFLDLEGNVVIFNEAVGTFLEKKGDEVLFRPFWENFPDDLFGFSIRESLKNHKCPPVTFINLNKSEGNQQELEVSPSFFGKAGSVQGLVIRVRNITEIRRLQAAADRHDRLMEIGAMASKVAHEIRNPLGGIKGFAALLERDLKEQPEMQQMAQAIVDGTDTLNQYVSNILDYSRPLQPHFELVDISKLAEEIHQHILADPQYNQNVHFQVASNPTQINVPIDAHFLRAALLNLILNGIQAMPNGGNLNLIIKKESDHICIKISDTGIGIPKANLNKIFTPFFTTKETGNGLGLAEVHKIIEAHHGSIDVESVEGKGTAFIIKIPLKQ